MKKRILLFLIPLLFLLTCKSNSNPNLLGLLGLLFHPGESSNSVSIRYSQTQYTFTINETISPLQPIITGGILSCSVSPNLPNGLELDPDTCILSGLPNTLQSEAEYTITLQSPIGTATVTLRITVDMNPPSNLTYADSPFIFTQNETIPTVTPTVTGTISNCVADPNLPNGLSLDAGTCEISGTPSDLQSQTDHTITASNSYGNTDAIIKITVNLPAPKDLKYPEIYLGLTKNIPMTSVVPTVSGTVTNCSVSPSLVSGLSLNTSNCTISGTPTSSQTRTTYTVTASNSGGQTQTAIHIGIGTSWAQEAYIKAPNAESNDYFGFSVGINGDTLVVGANNEDSSQTTITNGTTASGNGGLNSGAAYVFVRSGSTWSNQAYLKSSNSETNDTFGTSVGISGNTIVVGSDGEDSNQSTISNGTTASSNNDMSFAGAAYVFVKSGSNWSQQAYLKAPNVKDQVAFGQTVAIDGDTIVVGAQKEDGTQTTISNGTTAPTISGSSNIGAAYVFVRSGSNWNHQAYLKVPNPSASLEFGYSISIHGDTIVVGTPNEDSNQTTITNGNTASSNTSATGSGAVYVFKRTGNNWAQEAYIKAPNAEASDGFGSAIALNENTLVVSAPGEDSNQTTVTNGTTASSNNSATDSGAAYVFVRSGSNWTQQSYLKASNAEASDGFGKAVGLGWDAIAVGAHGEDSNQTTISNGTTASSNNSLSSSGAIYVFARSGSNWEQQAYLKAPNGLAQGLGGGTDGFGGTTFSVSGDTIAVGLRGDGSNQTTITNGTTASSNTGATTAGAVYIFRRQ